jgi:hypothetical protein
MGRLILKAVLAAALVLLNVYFAVTSNLLGDVLPSSVTGFIITITFLDAVRFAGHLHVLAYYVIDLEALILLIGALACVFLLTRSAGIILAVLRTLQALSMVMIVLPIEIYLFNSQEFTVYFTSFQALAGFLPWFSNEDLLVVCAGSLVVTTLLVWTVTRHSRRQRVNMAI